MLRVAVFLGPLKPIDLVETVHIVPDPLKTEPCASSYDDLTLLAIRTVCKQTLNVIFVGKPLPFSTVYKDRSRREHFNGASIIENGTLCVEL